MTSDAALDDLAVELATQLPNRVVRRAPVGELTTYRVGGPLAVLCRARRPSDLATLATILGARRSPMLVVGRGSNLLVADAGFAGVAVLLEGDFESLDLRDDGVVAGGAVPLPVVARRTAAAGLGGLEFLVGIPGTVGGAVRMNAGGHGREMRDVLRSALVADLYGDGEPRAVGPRELDLGYRRSALGPAHVVTAAELAATPAAPDAGAARVDEIVRWRRAHQPGGANAGSVFRNPPGDSAGRLIDVCGLKGERVGGAVVSDKHANFIQAEPGASAADVRSLVLEVQRQVAEQTGVELVPELTMVGFS